jgi:Spy/CpxP family protein refolding chaperone
MKNATTRILVIAVVLLLLVNIATLIYMVKGRRHHPEGKGGNPVEMMERDLNMTDQQKSEVKKLREAHFTSIKPLFDSVRAAKAAYFGLMKDSTVSDSVLSAYSKRIIEAESAVDKLTFEHFRTVRNLLNADQQKKYDDFVQKMMQRGPGGSGWKKDSSHRER